jgi:hypothetical protein
MITALADIRDRKSRQGRQRYKGNKKGRLGFGGLFL